MARSLLFLFVLLGAALSPLSAGAVPGVVTLTARVSDENGPVNRTVGAVFRLYDAPSDGVLVWEEEQAALPVREGLLYADLGAVDPANNRLDGVVFDGRPRFLEIQIDGEVLSPRIAVRSVPYAVRADRAARADTADRLGRIAEPDVVTGVTAGAGLVGGGTGGTPTLAVDPAAVQARVVDACPQGESIRVINDDGTVVCQADAVGAGDITEVTAGPGLAGGGATGDITLGVASGGITSSMIGAGQVRMDHTSAPIGGGSTQVTGGGGVFPSGAQFTPSANGVCIISGYARTTSTNQRGFFGLRAVLRDDVAGSVARSPYEKYAVLSFGTTWLQAQDVFTAPVTGGRQYSVGCQISGSRSIVDSSVFACEVTFACN